MRIPPDHTALMLIALAASAPAMAEGGDWAGLVDIGGGREIFLECRGTGWPTVALVSGKGNGAADWSQVLDPADPVRGMPSDAVSAGEGRLIESDAAVLPEVSRFTRVCAYDRPGTRIEGADISTPVAQPHRVDQAVDDLRAALGAAGESGPLVLVAHSYAGLIALLYARLYPGEVAGLVMVDAASDLVGQATAPDALAGWDASNRASNPAAPEAVELLDAIGKIEAAPPLPELPAVVLSADKPWQSPAPAAPGAMITFPEWLTAQGLLATYLNTAHVAETDSGHNLYLYQPSLVIDAIQAVVEDVRRSGGQGSAEVPDGFVWLRDVDPTIEQDIRYYGSHNITGRPLPGYQAPECLVTQAAAEALVAVQRELAGSRLSLKVYDCYRPQRAVDAFVAWSEDADDQAMKADFYPRIDKATVFDQGYFARKSGHTRGSTLDLTIAPVGHAAERAYVPGEPLVDCTFPASERFPDASLDFGTGFECLDEKTHHGRTDVPALAQANRLMLRNLMERHGFAAYEGEWWHYTLEGEPFPDTYFDFPITAAPGPGDQ